MTAIIGWDIGGAHLKAALAEQGQLKAVRQLPCPLWQDLAILCQGIEKILQQWPHAKQHVVTMTGELADVFPDRKTGITRIIEVLCRYIEPESTQLFAGRHGFVSVADSAAYSHFIASANWLVSAQYVAQQLDQGVFIDIGSTTVDIIAFKEHKVLTDSVSDADRFANDELVYTGVVRTPVYALAKRVPFAGRWQSVAAELFATSADIYRLLNCLPDGADQMPSADGRGKSYAESKARLARMLGRDANAASDMAWQQLAGFLARQQIHNIHNALDRVLANYELPADSTLVGAGVGRFLVKRLAAYSQAGYRDCAEFFATDNNLLSSASDCAPAAALACLASTSTW